MKKIIKSIDKDISISVISLILILGGFAYILHDKGMPCTEGWYTYYSFCINSGEIPYKDFSYLFSPFYLFTIACFTDYFGYEIIHLRILGVIFFILIGVGIYLALRTVFEDWIALISSITATLYLQTEGPQIFYDYVRFMDIFSIFSTLFLLLSVKSILKDSSGTKKILFLFITGLLNSCFILIKQNMGLIFWAFVIIALSVVYWYIESKLKDYFKAITVYFSGILIPILLVLLPIYLNGQWDYFLMNSGKEALAAKGGLLIVLFNWWYNSFYEFLKQANKTIFSLLCLIFFMRKCGVFKFNKFENIKYISKYIKINPNISFHKDDIYNKSITLLFVVGCIVALIILKYNAEIARFSYINKNLSPYLIFEISVIILIFLIFIIIKRKLYSKEPNLPENVFLACILLGAYFSISYGCGTSGGLVEGQAGLGLAFCIGLFLKFTCFNEGGRIFRIGIILICLLLNIHSMDKKMLYTYGWWGVNESNYWESNMINDVPLLKGILLSKETKYMYEKIYNIITTNTTSKDRIFCFPHIPIFYSITGRMDPGVYSKVQWFDVASDKFLESDINKIRDVKPKYILIYDTSNYVYDMHEKLFRNGKVSGTRIMRNALMKIINNEYTLSEKFINNNNVINLYVKNEK